MQAQGDLTVTSKGFRIGLMMEKEVAQVIELAGRGSGHVEYAREPSPIA